MLKIQWYLIEKKKGASKIENDILIFIRNEKKYIYAELKSYLFTFANRKTREKTD